MQASPVFKGLTRPAMIAGVPIVPLITVAGTIIVISIWTTKWLALSLFPAYIVMKFLAKEDEFIFNSLFLKSKFITPVVTDNHYKVKTIIANSYKPISKKVDFPELSVFGLDKIVSIEKFIPYSSSIADDIVVTKDFIMLTTFELQGVPFEIENHDEIDSHKNSLNMLLKSNSSKSVSFYTHNARHNIQDSLDTKYDNTFLSDLSSQYYDGFKNNDLKSNSLFITVALNPFVGQIEKSDFFKADIYKKQKEITQYIKKMHELTGRITANLSSFKPKKLGVYEEDGKQFNSQLEFFNFLLSGEFSKIRVFKAPINEYLTGGLQNIQFTKSMMQMNFVNEKKKFARGIEIKDYSTETYAGILNALMYTNINYTISQSYSSMSKKEAHDKLIIQKKQFISSEDDAYSQLEEFNEALDDLANGEINFGNYGFSLIVYGDSPKEVKENTEKIMTSLSDAGFLSLISEIALPATYFSQFPGNFALRPRVSLISSKNYADLIAMHNFPKGKRDNNCWGEATTILKTPNKQPYYLNLHETNSDNDFGDFHLGNTVVIGKSGGGKTAFMTFLMNMMMKYNNVDTFPKNIPDSKRKMTAIYLDKDKGAMGNILATGGKYLSIESGKPTGFNPFMCDNTPDNNAHLQTLVRLLVTRNGEKISSKEDKKLTDAINFLMTQFDKDEREYPISLLLENLTDSSESEDSIKDRLAIWKNGNRLGWIFDNKIDELDIDNSDTNIYGIDGTEFLDDNEVRGVISYYILWRVMNLMDGRRLGIFIDEAWKWIEEESISEEVKNKLKTNRKLNSFFVLVVQSVEDFLKNKNARAIIEQSATMIFFANSRALESEYVTGLNCTQEEYETIKSIDPSTYQFMVKKYDERVICQLDLSSVDKESIKILSTSKAYVDDIENIFNNSESGYEDKLNELKNLYKGKS